MRTFTALVLSIALAACSDLDMKEAGYRNNVKDFDGLIATASPEMKVELEQKKAAYVAEHGKLPTAEAERIAALAAMNERTDKELKELTERVEKGSAANAAANEQAMKEYQKTFVGTWDGDGMHLVVEPGGGVTYTRKKGGVDKSLSGASIAKFRKESFDVSLLGISTTFVIDVPPHQEDGAWKCTIDGAKLTRTSP